MGCHPEVRRQVRPRFAHEGRLDEVVVLAGVTPADALDGDLGVGVVVAVVVAYPDQLGVERARGCLFHLRGQEVGEPLGGEPVDVVDGVALAGQGVDEHPGACDTKNGALSRVLVIGIRCGYNYRPKIYDALAHRF